MNNLKHGVLVCAVAGLVGGFLPYLPVTGESVSFFNLTSSLGERNQFYITMVGFALPLAMDVIAVAKPPMLRWHGIVSIAGFAWVMLKLRDHFPKLITEGAIGAKLIALAAIVGLVFAILCVAKPEIASRRTTFSPAHT